MRWFFKYGIWFICSLLLSSCATAKLERRENLIDRQFGGFERSGNLERARTWLPIIQDNMVFALRKAPNLNYEFPLIQEHAKIVTAPNNRLRIFSWDNRAGRRRDFWSVVAQYRTRRGKTDATLLTDGYYSGPDAFLGAEVIEIFVIRESKRTFYLTLGGDLDDNGQERWIFQLLEVRGEKLVVCQDCFAGKKELIARLTEGEEFEYTFDPEKKTIEFLEFIIEPDGGDTSRKVKVVWKDDKFVKE